MRASPKTQSCKQNNNNNKHSMLFWSPKQLVFYFTLSNSQTDRERAMILLQSHSRFLLQTLLNRVHKFVPFLSLSLLLSKFIHIFLCLHFWFDCVVLIKQWNWITTGSSLTMFVSTFRSFSPSLLLYWFSLFNEVVSWIDLFL